MSDTFTFNGFHFDGTSIYFKAPGLNHQRAARDLQDVSLDIAMDGVQDVYGTSPKSRGSNLGRVKVNSPSMTFRLEAWDDLVKSPAIKQVGITRYIFDFTIQLKTLGFPPINIECKGARYLGWALQNASNSSNLVTAKSNMFIQDVLWNGVPLVVEN